MEPSSYNLSFSTALALLKEGKKLQRENWNGKNMYVRLQTPDSGSKMTLPYIYMLTAQRDLVPWVASHTDLLSNDWQVVH